MMVRELGRVPNPLPVLAPPGRAGVDGSDQLAPGQPPPADDRLLKRPPRRGAAAQRAPHWLGRLLGPALLLAGWWAITRPGAEPTALPSPARVVDAAAVLIADGRLQHDLVLSAQRGLAGLALGVGGGLLLALLAGLSQWGERLIDAILQVLGWVPILASVPLMILWLGQAEPTLLPLVAVAAAVPVYVSTHAALRGLDRRYLDLAATVGLGRWGLLRRVLLPAALPGLFAGLRVAVALAWLALALGELVTAQGGLGPLMAQAWAQGRTDVVLVGLAGYAVLGLACAGVAGLLGRRSLRWQSPR